MPSLLGEIEGLFGDVPAGMTPAAAPFSDPIDLVNVPAGQPAQERWPGALDPAVHTDSGTVSPQFAGPVFGDQAPEPFGDTLPHLASGGGWQDTGPETGHDAPILPWDSSAGGPFAPSGPVDPDLHGTDTGGVWVKEYVVPAEIGTLTRRTMTGQTWNRVAETQTEKIGQAVNNRLDLDQQQWHDPDGYDPWTIPYAERPILNNVAYEAMPIQPTDSSYTPAGALPDMSAYSYAAQAYEAPPDPAVASAPAPAANVGSGWLSG